jgi:multiple sugar transport system permease protein
MVYPFLIMLCMSVESEYDLPSFQIPPQYVYSDSALFSKYVESKYNGDVAAISLQYGTHFALLQDVKPPAHVDTGRVRDWNAFVSRLPDRYKTPGFAGLSGWFAPSALFDQYRTWLSLRFHGNIGALDRAYLEQDVSFITVNTPYEDPSMRNWAPDLSSVKYRDYAVFKRQLPPDFFVVVRADPLYQEWLKEVEYENLAALDTAWHERYTDFAQIQLSAQPAGNAAERACWETFVRTMMPFRFVHADSSALAAYRRFLARRYPNPADYRRVYALASGTPATALLPDTDYVPSAGPRLLDWLDFIKIAPNTAITADTADTRYRAFAESAYNLSSRQASLLQLPIWQADWLYAKAHAAELRRRFLSANYRLALQYMALHSDAGMVTLIYCGLAILSALIVNPLCAYALSRFNLSFTNSVLLFVLATMAFPADVTLIPNFLLLKQFHMLDTYWALILPTAASGYSIFLMKGFFDSLPKELYEAGMLDGASELRLFWQITLPLSRPIFAVIALSAFVASYGQFLYAMITCQDRHMWTIMVWLYELQNQTTPAPDYVIMAALTLSAIPTLLVFLFAQKVIMKGIILPSFK